MTFPHAIFLAVVGLVGGGVNAVAGGGSLIVFPAFLATGYGTLAANVTNSVSQWPGYVGGMLGFREELAGQRDRTLRLTGLAIVGGVVGSVVLLAAPPGAFDVVVPFLVFLASLLLAFQRKAVDLVRPTGETDRRGVLYPVIFAAGVYGGYFGGALGVILIGTLALTVSDTLRRLNALKTALSWIVSTVTVVAFGLFGPVNWAGVAVVAPAAMVGGFVGARVARRLNDSVLRWCVVAFGVSISVYLFLRR